MGAACVGTDRWSSAGPPSPPPRCAPRRSRRARRAAWCRAAPSAPAIICCRSPPAAFPRTRTPSRANPKPDSSSRGFLSQNGRPMLPGPYERWFTELCGRPSSVESRATCDLVRHAAGRARPSPRGSVRSGHALLHLSPAAGAAPGGRNSRRRRRGRTRDRARANRRPHRRVAARAGTDAGLLRRLSAHRRAPGRLRPQRRDPLPVLRRGLHHLAAPRRGVRRVSLQVRSRRARPRDVEPADGGLQRDRARAGALALVAAGAGRGVVRRAPARARRRRARPARLGDVARARRGLFRGGGAADRAALVGRGGGDRRARAGRAVGGAARRGGALRRARAAGARAAEAARSSITSAKMAARGFSIAACRSICWRCRRRWPRRLAQIQDEVRLADLELDEQLLRKLLDWQILVGVAS